MTWVNGVWRPQLRKGAGRVGLAPERTPERERHVAVLAELVRRGLYDVDPADVADAMLGFPDPLTARAYWANLRLSEICPAWPRPDVVDADCRDWSPSI